MKTYQHLLISLCLLVPVLSDEGAVLSTGADESQLSGQEDRQIVDTPPQQRKAMTRRAWIQEDYPNPEVDPKECRTTSDRLCDPDGILIDVERNRIIDQIGTLESTHSALCKSVQEPIEMAVALANRVDLIPFGPYEDKEEKAAKVFATYLHDSWGVGVDTSCGGTGIVLFLSVLDRALFISRGKALDHVLTDKRLDRIIDSIKPHLRNQDYAKAIAGIVDSLDSYLQKGEPDDQEKREELLETLIPLSFIGVIAACIGWKARRDQREARTYAHVESQLSQLDRDRAEALQGHYQATSCPICLDNFEEPAEGQDRPTIGSDGQPLKLLRCGHVFDETCWSEWVSSGTGNVSRCPICQQAVGGDGATTPLINERRVAQMQQEGAQQDQMDRLFRQFNRERNFRLARLGMRYPNYVRGDQLQRWTQSTYEGQLARDPTFVRNNPRAQHHHGHNNHGRRAGGGSRGFGGGSSGGGTGGRW